VLGRGLSDSPDMGALDQASQRSSVHRCAIVGAGEIADDIHMPAYRGMPGVQVVAVCESNAERAAWFRRRHRIPRVYRDFSELLADRTNIDFVDIATPPQAHYSQVKKSLEAGLDVLVEKPLALSAAAAEELGALATKQGRKLCTFQSYRFRDSVLRAADAWSSGTLGTLRQISIVSHGDDPFTKRSPWAWDEGVRKLLLYELGIHYVDLAVQFAGPSKIISGFQAMIDPKTQAVTRINAIVEHFSGIATVLDLQVLSSSTFVHFELFGSSQDVLLKFFPESFRMHRGLVDPLTEARIEVERILNVAIPTIKERLVSPRVKRRAVPHFRVLEGFVRCLGQRDADPPVSVSSVLPTLHLLDTLYDHI
jgi:scyllo-inositol 2-dehydrogenase (NADP+)